MNKFLVELYCSDECTYRFTEVYPLIAENKEVAERIVRKECRKDPFNFEIKKHPTISGVVGSDFKDIKIYTLEEFFKHA